MLENVNEGPILFFQDEQLLITWRVLTSFLVLATWHGKV